MADIPAALQEAFQEHQRLADIVFGTASTEQKIDAMNLIKQQSLFFRDYFSKCPNEIKSIIQSYVLHADMPLLNKTDFATTNGLAFCAEFGKTCAPASYQATRLLDKISELENRIIAWDVLTAARRAGYKTDDTYDFYYSSQRYASLLNIDGYVTDKLETDYLWAARAFEHSQGLSNVEIIFSRSYPAASHIPALKFKQHNPRVKWYAGFGDPLSMTALNKKSYSSLDGSKCLEYSNRYFENVELAVFDLADYVLFTNENQYRFTYDNCDDANARVKISNKHIILEHVQLDHGFSNIYNTPLALNTGEINIAYFGIQFYEGRRLHDFLCLLQNPHVNLHIFAPNIPDEETGNKAFAVSRLQLDSVYGNERVMLHDAVDNLEFLNIAKQMDYLYIEDLLFDGPINPYLPSKIADYLSTDSMIIASVQQGSALSKTDNPKILKIEEVTPEFLDRLSKQK